MKSKNTSWRWLITVTVVSFLVVQSNYKLPSGLYAHYFFLSQSLLNGRVDVTKSLFSHELIAKNPDVVFDYSLYQGKHFVPLGPFPAVIGILLLPFGEKFYHFFPTIALVLINLYLFEKMFRQKSKTKSFPTALKLAVCSPILTSLFFYGPWYLASLYTLTLGNLFVWHYLIKKNRAGIYWLIPLLLTRPSTLFYSLVPPVSWFINKKIKKGEIKPLFYVMAIVGITWSVYNFVRFDNPFEFGYRYQQLPYEKFREFRSLDRFSKDNFISNLFYLFLNPPRPLLDRGLRFEFPFFEISRFGVGLLFTTPWLLFPFLVRKRLLSRYFPALFATLLIITSSLLFNGEGSFQLVPRYAADWLPLALFIILGILKLNPKREDIFLLLLNEGIVFNFYLWFLLTLGHINRG